ncbi:MAG TPA: L,D-transpeptidase family protein [Thermomicrobiales bacterium]|nr:L,D-transpeptidase family protein [Thermomicrobiales bacterium]
MSNTARRGMTVAPSRMLGTTRRRLLAAIAGGLAARAAPFSRAARAQDAAAGVDASAQSAADAVPENTSRYFAEAGHNLEEPFLSRWQAAGGEAIFGPPLSEERYATGAGGVLQTFRGMTLLYDPSQQAPLDVRGRPFDKTQWRDLAPIAALRGVAGCDGSDPSCQSFADVGHTLSGDFAAFWNAHGGQPMLGMPVSEPFADPNDAGVTAQLFEAAMLESRPGSGVALRPMGQTEAAAAGGDPAFAAAPPNGGTSFQVASDNGLRLRAAPDGSAGVITILENNAEFIAAQETDGDWRPGYSDGRSGWVFSQYLTTPPPLPQIDPSDWNLNVWQGAALEETNVRSQPTTASPIAKVLSYANPVTVSQWVQGEAVFPNADMWAQLVGGGYVYGRNVGRNAPVQPLPPPSNAPTWGKWIDIGLIQQLMTAWDGQTAIKTVPVTTGMPGWETPAGSYQILSRVANETMTSGAIGAEDHYKLEDVLFTQYFTDYGHAIHFAWWRTKETIGRPGSHGCVNTLLEDARFFWDWAALGTPVIIHQ